MCTMYQRKRMRDMISFRHQTLPKEINDTLPDHGPIRISWQWFYFKGLWRDIRHKTGNCRFYMSSRGANFKSYRIGPIFISVRARWITYAAAGLHPDNQALQDYIKNSKGGPC